MMSSSDPFDFVSGNKTVIRPRPAGRKPSRPPRKPAPGPDLGETDIRVAQAGRSNIFIANAFALLSLVPKIRNLPVYSNIDGLYQNLINEIKEFEKRVLEQGVSEADARTSKLFLCALLDETILNTPWGSQSNWRHSNLSSLFFQHVNMGNTFFDETEKLKRQPSRTLELLKLSYVCLSLGFQGKYRTMSQGLRQLEQEREEIYRLIHQGEGDPERSLSAHWQGRPVANPLIRFVPLWVVSAVACLVLLLAFTVFLFFISRFSDSVYNDLIALGQETALPIPPKIVEEPEIPEPPTVPAEEPQRDETERFRKLLAPEIAKNMVKVLDGPLIRMSNTFLSGKDDIKKEFHPIFIKIANEVKDDDSRIEIFGHTDSQKIRFSLRFPDNFKLSEARAERAADIMRQAEPSLASRITAEGRGYSEPVVDNKTKENRAINRRIDMYIR